MSDEGQYTIGAEVTCSDGACGRLTRVVIDPVLRALTHIVVEPRSRSELGRLVPVDLVEETAGQIAMIAKMWRTGMLVERISPAIVGPAIEPTLATEVAQPAPLPR